MTDSTEEYHWTIEHDAFLVNSREADSIPFPYSAIGALLRPARSAEVCEQRYMHINSQTLSNEQFKELRNLWLWLVVSKSYFFPFAHQFG